MLGRRVELESLLVSATVSLENLSSRGGFGNDHDSEGEKGRTDIGDGRSMFKAPPSVAESGTTGARPPLYAADSGTTRYWEPPEDRFVLTDASSLSAMLVRMIGEGNESAMGEAGAGAGTVTRDALVWDALNGDTEETGEPGELDGAAKELNGHAGASGEKGL